MDAELGPQPVEGEGQTGPEPVAVPPAEILPGELPATPPPALPRAAPPTVRALAGGSLESLVLASPDLRRLSIALGLFSVVFVALPFAALAVYVFRSTAASLFGSGEVTGADAAALPMLVSITVAFVSIAVAFVALWVLVLEIQILVAATIGGRIAGAPLALRESLRRSRQVFWRVVGALFLVGLVTLIPNGLVRGVLASFLGEETQLAFGAQIVAAALLASPFVYVVPGIVLGDVGAVEAVRRSWRLARLRWRLALLIALFPAAGQLVLVFAIGAGLGLVGTILGLGSGGPAISTGLDPIVALIAFLALVSAATSLFIAIWALQAAPQVTGFHAMTRYAAGLDLARGGPPEPLFRRPALVVYGVGLLATIALLVTAVAPWGAGDEKAPVTVRAGGIAFDVPAGWDEISARSAELQLLNPGKTALVRLYAGRRSAEAILEGLPDDFDAERLEAVQRERVTVVGDGAVEESRFVLAWEDGVLRGVMEAGSVDGRPAVVVVVYDPTLGSGVLDLDALVHDDAIRFARAIWASGR